MTLIQFDLALSTMCPKHNVSFSSVKWLPSEEYRVRGRPVCCKTVFEKKSNAKGEEVER